MANKAELIEKVASSADLTKKDATAAVEAVFDSIKDTLADGEKYKLLVLVILKYATAQHVKDVILKQGKKSRFLQLKFQHSKLVKL